MISPHGGEKQPPKPKRGRPTLNTPGWLEHLAGLFGPELSGLTGERRQKRLRRIATFCRGQTFVLENGLSWIADKAVIWAGGGSKRAICTELGAMLDLGWEEADVLELGRQLCEQKPSTRSAVAQLRALRRPEAPDIGSADELEAAIEKTVLRYLTEHAAVGLLDAAAALEHFAQVCRHAAQGEAGDGRRLRDDQSATVAV